MDGKSICENKNRSHDSQTPHIVSLYESQTHRLIGQELTEIGSGVGGEKLAGKRLLPRSDLKNCLITADAGFTNGDFPQSISGTGADYLLRVKGNTQNLKKQMKSCLSLKTNSDYQNASLSGGKLSIRNIFVLPATDLCGTMPIALKNARQFGVIHKEIFDKKTGKTTQKEHFLSLRKNQASPQFLLETHTHHWKIENDLHRNKNIYLHENKRHLSSQQKILNLSSFATLSLSILVKISQSIPTIDTIRAKPNIFFDAYLQ